jgi:hypothetical protein
MNHTEAVEHQAAERYLLGELSETESEEFERHFFECQECTSDVEAGALFVDNARAVFQERAPQAATVPVASPAPAASRVRTLLGALAEVWRRPLVAAPSLAAIALAVLSSYQGLVVIPAMKRVVATSSTAHPLPTFQLLEAVRGADRTVSPPPGVPFFSLSFDPSWETPFPQYRCQLHDAGGALRFSVVAPAPPPGQPITILVPVQGVSEGVHSLTVGGIRSDASEQTPLATYSFTFRLP